MVRNQINEATLARVNDTEDAETNGYEEELQVRIEIVEKSDGLEWVRYCGECCTATEAAVLAMENHLNEDRVTCSVCIECKGAYYGEEVSEEKRRLQRDSQKLNGQIRRLGIRLDAQIKT